MLADRIRIPYSLYLLSFVRFHIQFGKKTSDFRLYLILRPIEYIGLGGTLYIVEYIFISHYILSNIRTFE